MQVQLTYTDRKACPDQKTVKQHAHRYDCTCESQAAEDLYQGLLCFFDEQPHLQQRPLFITGESYAGKYVPSIGERSAQPEGKACFSCCV
jgi:Serine carboxypeptidase